MKVNLLFLLVLTFIFKMEAQTTIINLTLFEEGFKVKDSMEIFVIKDKQYINLKILGSLLFIPDSLFKKKVNLEIRTNKYKLNFHNLIIGWNNKYLYWSIYVDTPPFEKKWVIKGNLKRKKFIYAIDRGNGTMVTYYSRKPMRLIIPR